VLPSKFNLDVLLFVSGNLRVPELKYNADRYNDCSQVIDDFFLYIYANRQLVRDRSLSDIATNQFQSQDFSIAFLNNAFVIDRSFDVWLRKLQLDSRLNKLLREWRIFSLDLLVRYEAVGFEELMAVLDNFAQHLVTWSTNPKRAEHVLPNELNNLGDALSKDISIENLRVQVVAADSILDERNSKHLKVSARLVDSEATLARKQFNSAWAQGFINHLFSNKALSSSMQVFLETVWLETLSNRYGTDDEAGIPAELIRLSKKLKIVFCDKGRGVFQFADSLIEELSDACGCANIEVARSLWDSLAEEVLAIVKGIPLAESKFNAISQFLDADKYSKSNVTPPAPGNCYLEVSTGFRAQVQAIYPEYGQLLLSNHLGMKLALMTYSDFSEKVSARELTKLPAPSLFSSVLAISLKGLDKVAQTQKAARSKAAEKARNEAEQLLKQQQDAADEARLKAQEIAERTRNIAFKKEEAKRIQDEARVLAIVDALSLGAWISVMGDEGKQRYKLAVKLAATGKYLFVDKFGIKKLEFKEAKLVAAVIDASVEVLSDGAEFEDSLERVVSRIRMSK